MVIADRTYSQKATFKGTLVPDSDSHMKMQIRIKEFSAPVLSPSELSG